MNRAYCESLGDYSFGPWEDAPEWQKAANRAGVVFHLCHPEAPPSASHELNHYCPGTAHIKYAVITRFSDGLNTMVPA